MKYFFPTKNHQKVKKKGEVFSSINECNAQVLKSNLFDMQWELHCVISRAEFQKVVAVNSDDLESLASGVSLEQAKDHLFLYFRGRRGLSRPFFP